MSKKKISFIEQINGLISECPYCHSPNQSDNWFFGNDRNECSEEQYQKQLRDIEVRKEKLKSIRDQVYQSTYTTTKFVNIGFISERLFPALPSFRFDHNDCRSTGGDPIDYVVFEGLSTKGYVESIQFIDVKTGMAKLTPRQEEIKKVINDRNVKFRTY